jgi:hypothetical protein
VHGGTETERHANTSDEGSRVKEVKVQRAGLNERAAPNAEVVRAVLIAEREPRDPSWRCLCVDVDAELVTPANLRPLLD